MSDFPFYIKLFMASFVSIEYVSSSRIMGSLRSIFISLCGPRFISSSINRFTSLLKFIGFPVSGLIRSTWFNSAKSCSSFVLKLTGLFFLPIHVNQGIRGNHLDTYLFNKRAILWSNFNLYLSL